MAGKRELPSVSDRFDEVMETICSYCRYPIQTPTEEERLTGCCAQCEICPIDGKIKELGALVRGVEIVESAKMLALAHADVSAEIESRWNHENR